MASTVDIKLTLDQSEFINAMKKADKVVENFSDDAQQELKEVGDGFTVARGAAAAFIGAFAVDAVQAGLKAMASTIGDVVTAAAEIETMTTQFTTLTGSVESAEGHIKDLVEFSKSTPFQLEGLANASKLLQSFGFDSQSVIPILTNLGDIAAVSGNDISDLAVIFGQVSAAGKLTGERLLQLQERGIPVLRALAENFGTTEAAVREMVTEGQVSFEEFQKSMQGLTKEGAQFFNGMATLSETFSGKLSTLGDNFAALAATAGESLLPIAKNLIDIALKVLPAVTAATGDFMLTALPGFQVLSDLITVFTADVNDASKGMTSASDIGTTFSDVMLSLGKGVVILKTGFTGLFEIIRAGTAAAVWPLVASLRTLAVAADAVPGIDLSKQIQSLDKDMAALSKEVTGVSDRLVKLGTRSAIQIQFLEAQNNKTKELIKAQQNLKNINKELTELEDKGISSKDKTVQALINQKKGLQDLINFQQDSIKTTALETIEIEKSTTIRTNAYQKTQKARVEATKQANESIKTSMDEFRAKEVAQQAVDKENAIIQADEKVEAVRVTEEAITEVIRKEEENRQSLRQNTVAASKRLLQDSLQAVSQSASLEIQQERDKFNSKKEFLNKDLQETRNKLNEEAKLQKENTLKQLRNIDDELVALKQSLSTATEAEKTSIQKRIVARNALKILIKRHEEDKLSSIKDRLVGAEKATERQISSEKRAREGAAASAFRTQKRAQKGQAIMAGALALVRVFSDLGPVGGAIAAPGIAAVTGAQIAAINNQRAPRFQDGGIVPGSSFTGDRVNARLNSGEMVLNRGQQQNLFNQINSGNISSGTGNLEKRIAGLEKAIMAQPIVVEVDGTEIARATRDAEQAGFN